jgi:nucleotide-binding universal stress UspA family protein
MRSIVVPVNFTANSANAARYAADLALVVGADIHLIHVFQIPVSVSEVPMPESVFEELRDNGIELLAGLQAELTSRTSGKIAIITDMETGGVETKIETYCKDKKPLLVVMGTSGESLQNGLSGSTTVRETRHLPYPILVVPHTAKFHAVEKIVVACDREDIDSGMPATLPFLKELSELLGARLEVVHVLTNGEESAAEAAEEYNVWKKEVRAFNPKMHFIRRPKVEEGISDYLEGHGADWVMVFPKSHSVLEFHRSRSKQVLQHCLVPVMSVHE